MYVIARLNVADNAHLSEEQVTDDWGSVSAYETHVVNESCIHA